MRVVSWNTQYATTNALSALGQGQYSESEFRAALRQIAGLEPDVVAFQEVERGQGRAAGLDQPRIIEQEMKAAGMAWTAFAPSYMGWAHGLRLYPDPKVRDDWPAFGVMLATREHPRTWKVARLGKAPVRWVSTGESVFQGKPAFGENRVLLAAVLPSGFVLGTTHLEIHASTAKAQARRALQLLSGLGCAPVSEAAATNSAPHDLRLPSRPASEVPARSGSQPGGATLRNSQAARPSLLVGDFNLSPAAVQDALKCEASLDAGLGADFDYHSDGRVNISARTFPSAQPVANMDQAVLDPGSYQPKILGAGTLPLPVSDHAAFVLEVATTLDSTNKTDAKA
ncbi:MAG: endonuclease/exonuclease/phosphatase family protein [Gleimia sp.]